MKLLLSVLILLLSSCAITPYGGNYVGGYNYGYTPYYGGYSTLGVYPAYPIYRPSFGGGYRGGYGGGFGGGHHGGYGGGFGGGHHGGFGGGFRGGFGGRR